MATTDHLARYRDRCDRLAAEFGPGHHGADNLSDAVAKLIQEFVEHDTEWCAVATEELVRSARGADREVTDADLLTLAASFRRRGRGEG